MRKWLPGADKLRPDVWLDVDNMVPTPVGTYHTMPTFGSNTVTGGNAGTANYVTYYAYATQVSSGAAVTYVAGETSSGSGSFYVESISTTALTNRSPGGASFGTGITGTDVAFAQMGNTSLVCIGDGLIYSRDATTANNFASAASYSGKILVTQSNALLMFNLNDGGTLKPNNWMASDLGAPTTFTGGESVAPTAILDTPGEITAAVAFGSGVIVFKRSGVYRMQYIGGTFIWSVTPLRSDIGVKSKHAVINTGDSLIFLGEQGVWEYDGANFRFLSEDCVTPAGGGAYGYVDCTASQYYPGDRSCVWYTATGALFYNRTFGAFGRGTFYINDGTALTGYVPIVGKATALVAAGYMARASSYSFYDSIQLINVAAARLREGSSGWDGTNSAYVTSAYIGDYQKDTTARRVIPKLRNTYYAFSAQVADDGLQVASGFFDSGAVNSATDRKRFDGFVTFKYPDGTFIKVQNRSTYDGPWEIEDIIVEAQISGAT